MGREVASFGKSSCYRDVPSRCPRAPPKARYRTVAAITPVGCMLESG
jgi:hypothetical protein